MDEIKIDEIKIKELSDLTGKSEDEIKQAYDVCKKFIDKLYEIVKPMVDKITEFIKAVREGIEKFWNSLDDDTKRYITEYYRMKEEIKVRMKRQHMLSYAYLKR